MFVIITGSESVSFENKNSGSIVSSVLNIYLGKDGEPTPDLLNAAQFDSMEQVRLHLMLLENAICCKIESITNLEYEI